MISEGMGSEEMVLKNRGLKLSAELKVQCEMRNTEENETSIVNDINYLDI